MTLSSPGSLRTAEPDRPTMRAVVIDGFGGVDRLRLGDVPVPRRVMSEVLVRVVAAGLNPIDAKTRAGAGAAAGIGSWPAVLGCDFSGIVEESPFESFGLRPGDEVYGVTAFPRGSGSFAEHVSVPASNLALKPRVLAHAEAAAVPLAALTAWGAVVELAKAHEGQRVLVHAGAGGVGHFAVQIGAYFGAHVIATGSTRNHGWLRDLGAAEVVDRNETRMEESIAPVDAIVDLVGDGAQHTGPRSLAALRPGGLLVNVPSGSWPTLQQDAERAGVRATTYHVVPDTATLAVIARLIVSGDLAVSVQQVFPMAEIARATQLLEQGHVRGKLVLQVSDY